MFVLKAVLSRNQYSSSPTDLSHPASLALPASPLRALRLDFLPQWPLRRRNGRNDLKLVLKSPSSKQLTLHHRPIPFATFELRNVLISDRY